MEYEGRPMAGAMGAWYAKRPTRNVPISPEFKGALFRAGTG